jgi:hypothetical protein
VIFWRRQGVTRSFELPAALAAIVIISNAAADSKELGALKTFRDKYNLYWPASHSQFQKFK